MKVGERTVTDITDITDISDISDIPDVTNISNIIKHQHYFFPSFRRCLVSLFPGGCLNPLASVLWWECSVGPVGLRTLTPYRCLPSIGINPFFSQRCYKENITKSEKNHHFCRNPVARNLEPTECEIASWVASSTLTLNHFCTSTPPLESFLFDGPA